MNEHVSLESNELPVGEHEVIKEAVQLVCLKEALHWIGSASCRCNVRVFHLLQVARGGRQAKNLH